MPTAVAPVAVEYLFKSQSVHAAEPVAGLYFPAAHAAHVPPLGPVNPRLQTQLVNAVDPDVVENVFTGHATQSPASSLPSVARYLPLVHSEQTLAPKVDEYLPMAHCEHTVSPEVDENLPTSHDTQDAARYWPATQSGGGGGTF